MAEDILVQDICKAYNGVPVLLNFSAVLPSGQATVLYGPSGCGKTTLGRLLLGLEQPDSGTLGFTDGRLPRFSCVFQEDRLVHSMNALDNAALVLPRGSWQGLHNIFQQVGLTQADVGKPVGELSGGQRRRVALVRAMEAESNAVLLDEPFTGLDVASRELVLQYVQQRLAGRTLVLITHDQNEARRLGQHFIKMHPAGKPAHCMAE